MENEGAADGAELRIKSSRIARLRAARTELSRKNSADAPFSMLNSVNTEIFITLSTISGGSTTSPSALPPFRALDHDDAWRRLHALVHEPHSFRYEPHARALSSSTHSRSGRNTNAALPRYAARTRQQPPVPRPNRSRPCLAVRFSAVGAFAPALRSKYGGLQMT